MTQNKTWLVRATRGAMVLSALVAGCSASVTNNTHSAKQTQPRQSPNQCTAKHGGALKRVGPSHAGSTVLLATHANARIAIVADEDDSLVHVVDIDSAKELSTTALSGVPSQLTLLDDGRVAIALRDKNKIAILEAPADISKPFEDLCAVDVPSEPVGITTNPDGNTLYVTSGWGHALTAINTASMKATYSLSLPREPRAIEISDDGHRAFISHAVGSRMSVVDLENAAHPVIALEMGAEDPLMKHRRGTNKQPLLVSALKGESDDPKRIGCQGFTLAKTVNPPGRVVAPQVLVDPGDNQVPSNGYGDAFRPTESASIVVLDQDTGNILPSSLKSPTAQQDGQSHAKACLLPRASAADPNNTSVFVTCLGSDAVVEYDSVSADPRTAEKRRWQVAAGPIGIAVDPDQKQLVVWSQFEQTLTTIPLHETETEKQKILALSRKAKSAAEGDIALGRKLFHSANDPRIASDGRACASCHPDGRDDAITWATPEGPRNTPMLAGRLAKSAPFGWNGTTDKVQDHVRNTFSRLRGSGLQTRELNALVAYIHTMETPEITRATNEKIAKGKSIFESQQTGCASCHREEHAFADAETHDVFSRTPGDSTPLFDTPSLKFVAGTAPYYHDGRYQTLRALLQGVDGTMGHTKHLSNDELDALEAYLKTL